jgi:hypothetical protein
MQFCYMYMLRVFATLRLFDTIQVFRVDVQTQLTQSVVDELLVLLFLLRVVLPEVVCRVDCAHFSKWQTRFQFRLLAI